MQRKPRRERRRLYGSDPNPPWDSSSCFPLLKDIKISLYLLTTTTAMDHQHINFAGLTATLKAAGEPTRLRILALLAEAELTVSDLTEILRQSQPRLSRHLRLLSEAGLIDRFREGSWAFFRLGERGGTADLARVLIGRLKADDAIVLRDRERLAAVRTSRAAAAQNYFRRHAAEWDRIRRLHVADAAVEAAIRAALADKPIRALLDLGTGTGRMLELFGAEIERGLGLDLSLDMLALARARLDRAGLKHCTVRHGDIYDLALPRDSFDVVIIHQVLHFLDDSARAIAEAARVLRPGGRLLVVDFAPHDLEFLREEHAHRRLGFAAETVTQWLEAAGLDVLRQETLPPGPQGKIAVSLWLARDPRIVLAAPASREVA
jgi:ubiquinone/menaquinone biosynthesis C-methylase UbiE/DNA-binding transcriptional ArsR family regulator